MKKSKLTNFAILSAVTFVLWYAIIAFILWDGYWIKEVATMSNTDRALFIGGIVIKTLLDAWIFSIISAKYFDRDPNKDASREEKEKEKLETMFNRD